MNKPELSSRVAADASLSKASADSVIDAVFSTITDTLVRGENVAIAGFGTFTPRARAARQGRNPQTGEPITIARLDGADLQGRKDSSRRGQEVTNRAGADCDRFLLSGAGRRQIAAHCTGGRGGGPSWR